MATMHPDARPAAASPGPDRPPDLALPPPCPAETDWLARHGPSEADRRAAAAAIGRPPAPPCWAADEALALLAADRRNAWPRRGLAWLGWAYNRSPLRPLLDLSDWASLLGDGLLPPLWRRLARLGLPAARDAAYAEAARQAARRSSGWAGALVSLVVWVGLVALLAAALLAALV